MDFSAWTSFVTTNMVNIWNFCVSNWLLGSALLAGLVLPKIVRLVKRTFGK